MSLSETQVPQGWARPWAVARPFARPMPRAGAWYPVVGETTGERAVLEIRGKRVAIQKKLFEIRQDRPKTFTVVVRSRSTVATVAESGVKIDQICAVCPLCTERVRIQKNDRVTSCPECSHRGEVAWWETG